MVERGGVKREVREEEINRLLAEDSDSDDDDDPQAKQDAYMDKLLGQRGKRNSTIQKKVETPLNKVVKN